MTTIECPNDQPSNSAATTEVVRERPITKGKKNAHFSLLKRSEDIENFARGVVESVDVCSVSISRRRLKVSRTTAVFNDQHLSSTTLAASMLLQHPAEKTQTCPLPHTQRVPWH